MTERSQNQQSADGVIGRQLQISRGFIRRLPYIVGIIVEYVLFVALRFGGGSGTQISYEATAFILVPVLLLWLLRKTHPETWRRMNNAGERTMHFAFRMLAGIAALVGLWFLYKLWVPPIVDKILGGLVTAVILAGAGWGIIRWMFHTAGKSS